ncbi:MAG: TolC family protein [Flavobacteriaceae bacterium]|nr:TolC family protein [Flavobacteriaceae bacterium]
MKSIKILFGIWLSVSSLSAQELLTKEAALKQALEHNYGIRMANNQVEIAKNNASVWNNRLLPTLQGRAGANYQNGNQEVVFQDGNKRNADGAETKTYNASINLNYTVFDGLNRHFNFKIQKENHKMSALQARATIEQTVLQLFQNYYQIGRLSEQLRNLQENLAISNNRLERATYQNEYGQGNSLDLLQAEVDTNNDSIAYNNTVALLSNAKRDLNVLLGRNVEILYTVEPENENFLQMPIVSEVIQKAKASNVNMKQLEQLMQISKYTLKAGRSGYLPTLNLSGSYGLNKSFNPATSFSQEFRNVGFNAGLSLSWNLFDGGATKTRVANAKIALANQEISEQQQWEQIENNIRNLYNVYENNLYVVAAQRVNLKTSKNNLDRTQELAKYGRINSVTYRQAQLNYLNAKTAYSNAKYDAKILELQLLQLAGDLLERL